MTIKFSSTTGAFIEFDRTIDDIIARFDSSDTKATYFTEGDGEDTTYHVYINDQIFGWAHPA